MSEEFPWASYDVRGGKKVGAIIRKRKYDCSFCKGTGERPKGTICTVCSGTRRISIKPPVVICAHCKGSGEEHLRGNLPCIACKGIGYIKVVEPIEICPDCHGTGTSGGGKFHCIRCRGAGVVTKAEIIPI